MNLENGNNVNHSYNLRSRMNIVNIITPTYIPITSRTNTNSTNNRRNTQTQKRKCSFCACDGHIITNCNNIVLLYFEKLCMLKKKELEESSHRILFDLTNWIYMYSIENTNRMVQVLAITRCGATTRTPMGICFNQVIQYILNLTTEDIINNQRRLDEFTDTDMTEIFIISSSIIALHLMPILVAFQGYKNQNMNKKEKINIILSDDNDMYKIDDINYEDYEECVICYDNKHKNEFVSLNCNHEFCGTCIKNVLKKEMFKEESNCALCRKEITTIKCRTKKCVDDLCQIFNN